MGAWIEIFKSTGLVDDIKVAPFMGAWIEIVKTHHLLLNQFCRTLYGCVD